MKLCNECNEVDCECAYDDSELRDELKELRSELANKNLEIAKLRSGHDPRIDKLNRELAKAEARAEMAEKLAEALVWSQQIAGRILRGDPVVVQEPWAEFEGLLSRWDSLKEWK